MLTDNKKKVEMYLLNEDNFYPCTNRECEGCFGQIKEDKLITFILSLCESIRAEALKEAIKSLPEELGFEDYDKHMHSYIFEGRGKCEICGLSWKKAGEYEMFNNAIIIMKKRLAVLAKLSQEEE